MKLICNFVGLLASLWQFPLANLPSSNDSTPSSRNGTAVAHCSSLEVGPESEVDIQHEGEIGSLIHVFSHLKLTMYVHLFNIELQEGFRVKDLLKNTPTEKKWVEEATVDDENLWTGMRRVWHLAQT